MYKRKEEKVSYYEQFEAGYNLYYVNFVYSYSYEKSSETGTSFSSSVNIESIEVFNYDTDLWETISENECEDIAKLYSLCETFGNEKLDF